MNFNDRSSSGSLASHFINLFSLAIADSDVSATELELFYKIGIENGISKEEIDFLIENPHKVAFVKPESVDDTLDQIYDFCRMILADNKVDVREIMFFKTLGRQLNFDDAQSMSLLTIFIDGLKNGDGKIQLIAQAKHQIGIN